MHESDIVVRGAREHNLQNVDLTLPRNKLIVMTGVSGSGKSSLAFDTLYAEGQRRYVESLSSYARQFLGQMPKPAVDAITGLAPSISIQQKTAGRNPRSTVGTITEIYDYLRVLFARVGEGHCPDCGRAITAQSTQQIIDTISAMPTGTKFQILAPVIQQQKGEYRDLFEDLLKQGFLRARVNGNIVQLTDDLQLDRQMRHTIEVVVDRLTAGKTNRGRLAEAVESALKLANGSLLVSTEMSRSQSDLQLTAEQSDEPAEANNDQNTDRLYSSRYACTHCGIGFEPPSPQLFSFNSPMGMCHDCNGLGMRHDFVLQTLIPDGGLSLAKGAIELIGPHAKIGKWRRHIYDGAIAVVEKDHGLKAGTLLKTPWRDLDPKIHEKLLFGLGERNITFSYRHHGGTWKHGGKFEGYANELMQMYRTAKNPMRRRQLEKYMAFANCGGCGGSRLNQQARAVKIETANKRFIRSHSISRLGLPDVCSLSIADAAEFFEALKLDDTRQYIASEALKEIRGRLGFLLKCGLNYLALDRTAPTLSGGEAQRIRLASQIGCGLVGVVYILDEPSIGLHPRDNHLLLASLCDLRDQGNTVFVVEHDEDTMRAADHIVDFGPGPGVRGGEVVYEGPITGLKKSKKSLTGQYLSGRMQIAVPEVRRPRTKTRQIKIVGAEHNNLKNVDAAFPLGTFICVTGVSGSGKSSLVNDILWQVLNRDVNKGNGNPGKHKRVTGLQFIDKAIDIDQSAIGRTPRSNPATYVKLFDLIRDLYTKLPDSKIRGYKPGRFSFNVPAGRCEACEGYGSNKLEMDFLADIWVTCPMCEGRRFNHETLEIRFKNKNIAEVLELDIAEALTHFEHHPKIGRLLNTLHAVGLDYLKLGQPSPTLSGGEAQRIKLARELGKRSTGTTFYLLDEPTTGLHFADIQMLLEVLHGFVDDGNTVLVVEHNIDVIKTADWIIDLGPQGGAGGGTIVAQGTPEDIAMCADSETGQALRDAVPQFGKGVKRKSKKKNRAESPVPSAELHNGMITIRGASQHNLQQVDLELPRNRMNVFCGPSGSGKTSLAMDTLYAEGQRRYVESLSAYARQFLGQMPKPRVDHIHGLSPSIAIEQKSSGHTPRSTVGTVTEIYDYLRILFARLGQPVCPDCDIPVETQTTDEVIEQILKLPDKTRVLILAPQEVTVGQSYERFWESLKARGFSRVRVDGTSYRIEDVPEINRRRKHQIEIVVDRASISRRQRSRLAESVEAAFGLGKGQLLVAHADGDRDETEWNVDHYSLHFACGTCGRSFEELTPHNFSFNSSLGWCEACEGLGTEQGTNPAALIADPERTLLDGAIAAWPDVDRAPMFARMLEAVARQFQIPLDVPYRRLSPKQQRTVLFGTGNRWIDVASVGQAKAEATLGLKKTSSKKSSRRKKTSHQSHDQSVPAFRFQYKGLYPAIEEASRISFVYRQRLTEHMGEVACSACQGSRLRDDAAAVQFNGRTLGDLCSIPLADALAFLKSIRLKGDQKKIAGDLLTEAVSRMTFLVDVGLHYLSLARPLPSLSGGETQRIRLAGQIGRALTGVLYVLDEPTIGLHPRDNTRLISALTKLRDLGNTLLLVEHDREVLESSDRLFDFGPGAGRFGGNVVAEGTPKQVAKRKASLTGQFLSHRKSIPIPAFRRMKSADDTPPGGGWLELIGARQNNLRNVDLKVPLGTLTCVTGVSGSGKSSLIEDTLSRAIAKKLHRAAANAGPYAELRGLDQINKIIVVDQQPIGNTPASNPATYTGVFEHIRDLFTRLPESRVRGFRPGRFSFNRTGGRCDACEGLGQKCIEMHFLPDVWVECDVCHGKRYNLETLAVTYNNRSIADVLEMPIGESLDLFKNIPKIRGFLATLVAVGLDYLTLGQSAPTLSGGEAQRVKLASELARPQTGQTLYVLDEPTTGLHFDDIAKLLKVLNSLVEQGNTVVVIEHNLDVAKTADWLIDIGPESGSDGGWIIGTGTPEQLVQRFGTPPEPAVSVRKKSSRKKAAKKKAARKKASGKVVTRETLPESGDGTPAGPLRSWTAECLVSVLQAGNRAERDIFDVEAVAEHQDGDMDMRAFGREQKMPWQRDGHRWHTREKIANSGKRCRWEGAALDYVIDFFADDERFEPPDWNDQARVELTANRKQSKEWFLHAQTGDEWLLQLRFRVKKGTFDMKALDAQLGLKPIDDIDELEVYGRGKRVRDMPRFSDWQELVVSVHWKREIDTPEFRDFLTVARDSYILQVDANSRLSIDDHSPWKKLGKKWHLMRKGFPANKNPKWKAEVLDQLANDVELAIPGIVFDWTGRQFVYGKRPADPADLMCICTKRRAGLDFTLFVPEGTLALGRISAIGTEQEIKPHNDGRDAVRMRFLTMKQLGHGFRELLTSVFSD